MRRGEVWWYEGPETKRRPVLILTRSEAIERLHDVLVAPATRTLRGIPTEVSLDEGDGMPKPCALNLDNAFLAEKTLLVERLTEIGAERMDEACRALVASTSCG